MGSLIAPSSFYHPKAVELNGTNEYLSRTGSISFVADTAGALSFWARPASVLGSNGGKFILNIGTSGQARLGFGVRRNGTTGASTYLNITGLNAAGTLTAGMSATTTALAANTLYHFLWQSDGTSYTCYINGVAQTLTDWTGIPTTNNGNWFGDYTGASPWLTIGVQNSLGAIGSSFFDGRIDQLTYIGGRALTSGEVAETYGGGVRTNPHEWSFAADVDLWLPLGDSRDDATTVFDEVGSNDLTLVNMDASNYVTP